MMITPCKDCPARHPVCHDSCLKYAEFKRQRGGRRGIFARFGLGKTIMQLEWCRLLQKHEGGQTLVVMPLNVLQEFKADAVNLMGMDEPPNGAEAEHLAVRTRKEMRSI